MKPSSPLKALFGRKDGGGAAERAPEGAPAGSAGPETARRCPYDPSVRCSSRTESGCWSCTRNRSLF